ncbi:MAG TPA: RNA degradosome polyphosphate kinase [Thermotogota bacterium]|nr:RNA degradosome polyphosphate kinase [Thermotogota bacterium]HNT94806.1 RNA degradosome polyphosphate kinase [Thermotogota bacterium]HOZ11790.1 RNA degradosome polyphosphate kinase [Thermotogota bacterium]HPB86993.1 RNA degradosome polyphosphate kinase [Thermotogota bacterium]HPH09716.1 RNA degradosome polyphosphate kinase [Thermotogota bacterium]
MTATNLEDPSLYLNRELSWLAFNERVVDEAFDKDNPLLERLKFLSISGSNLDEFFMIRVAGLKEQKHFEYTGTDPSGSTAEEQLAMISQKVHEMVKKQYLCLNRELLPKLKKSGIEFLEPEDLNQKQNKQIAEYFFTVLFPVLTPMAIDQSRPFPMLPNKSLNQAILLRKEESHEPYFALVQVPAVLPRFIELGHRGANDSRGETRKFILLEKIVALYVKHLFRGYEVLGTVLFRITRNADLSIDEEDTQDLLEEIEKSLRQRQRGFPVRLEIESNAFPEIAETLSKMLEIDGRDIYEIPGPIDLSAFMKMFDLQGFSDLRYAPFKPQLLPDVLEHDNDFFLLLKEKDLMVHHPYHSFHHVVEFLEQAANDPKVLAIKQTLYRVSSKSPIVERLIQAAENGKHVTVLMELKARFDEENNIQWAKRLENAGCYVIYGLVGLKTHCKVLLVVRQEEDGIRRYVHLSTGNYNENTARIYTDLGLFTSKEAFGADASALFNVLTGYSEAPQWNVFSVAPKGLRETVLQLIDREIGFARAGQDARIIFKINSLLDKEIIKKLYEASMTGVRVDLLVRGICAIKPGVAGVSERIRVMSIVGRFLEHHRIFYFENGGNNELFLSSSDLMPRNLDRRVEVFFPILDETLKKDVYEVLELMFSDTIKGRLSRSDGAYTRIDKRGRIPLNAQEELCKRALIRSSSYKETEKEIVFRPKVKEFDI